MIERGVVAFGTRKECPEGARYTGTRRSAPVATSPSNCVRRAIAKAESSISTPASMFLSCACGGYFIDRLSREALRWSGPEKQVPPPASHQ